jgi:hypothetical protein
MNRETIVDGVPLRVVERRVTFRARVTFGGVASSYC